MSRPAHTIILGTGNKVADDWDVERKDSFLLATYGLWRYSRKRENFATAGGDSDA